MIFILYQFIGGIIVLVSGGTDFVKDVNLSRTILTFGQYMFILAPAWFFTRLQTTEIKEAFRLHIPKPLHFSLAVFGIITIQPFLQGILVLQEQLISVLPIFKNEIIMIRDFYKTFDQNTLNMVRAYSISEFLVIVFSIAVTPAICEEILFRGFVLHNLGKIAKPSISVFFTGFLFAFYHLHVFNIIPLILLGWFLSFITFYSGSIFPAVTAHFLNNFFSAYFVFRFGSQELPPPSISSSETADTLILAGISCVLFAGVVLLFYRFRIKQDVTQ